MRERGVKCTHMIFLTTGQVLLTPSDLEAAEYLLQLKEVDGNEIQLKTKGLNVSNGVLLKYPILMPLSPIERHLVLEAKKCKLHIGEPTRQVEVTVKGPLPGFLELEDWGTFYTRPYNREPLRCFRCHNHCAALGANVTGTTRTTALSLSGAEFVQDPTTLPYASTSTRTDKRPLQNARTA